MVRGGGGTSSHGADAREEKLNGPVKENPEVFKTTDVRDTLRHQWPAIGDDHEYSTHAKFKPQNRLVKWQRSSYSRERGRGRERVKRIPGPSLLSSLGDTARASETRPKTIFPPQTLVFSSIP